MIRTLSITTLFLSTFFFPALLTMLGMAVMSLFMPAITLLIGVLMDLLYASDTHFPIGTVTALVLIGIAYFVRTFMRSHILEA